MWAVPELFVSSRACETIMTHNDDCKLLIAKCICAIRLFEGMWDYSLQIVDCKMYLCYSSLRGHVSLQNVSVLFVSSRACEISHCKLLIAKCICAIRRFEGMWDHSLQSVDCKLLSGDVAFTVKGMLRYLEKEQRSAVGEKISIFTHQQRGTSSQRQWHWCHLTSRQAVGRIIALKPRDFKA